MDYKFHIDMIEQEDSDNMKTQIQVSGDLHMLSKALTKVMQDSKDICKMVLDAVEKYNDSKEDSMFDQVMPDSYEEFDELTRSEKKNLLKKLKNKVRNQLKEAKEKHPEKSDKLESVERMIDSLDDLADKLMG